MKIPIGKFLVETEGANYIITEKKKRLKDSTSVSEIKYKKGDLYFADPSYYSTIESTLKGLLERKIKGSDATTLVELARIIEGFRQDINVIIDACKQIKGENNG